MTVIFIPRFHIKDKYCSIYLSFYFFNQNNYYSNSRKSGNKIICTSLMKRDPYVQKQSDIFLKKGQQRLGYVIALKICIKEIKGSSTSYQLTNCFLAWHNVINYSQFHLIKLVTFMLLLGFQTSKFEISKLQG